ncbi:hypothetical protein [Pseudomonas sp. AK106]
MTSLVSKLKLWEEPLLRKYLGEIRRKCGVVETLALPSMRDLPTIQIETLFVPPLLSETAIEADAPSDSWPSGSDLLTALQDNSQIVVLGDPGGGKTTLSNWLAWRLTSGANAPLPPILENMLPIPCILRDMPLDCFSDGCGVVELAVAVANKLLGASVTEAIKPKLSEWVRAGQYVLILDGVDEIPIPRRGTVASWMREAHVQSACVLATSRIIGYEDYPIDSFVMDSVVEKAVNDDGDLSRESKSKTLSIKKRLKGYGIKSADGSVDVIDTSIARSWAQIRYLMPFDQIRISDFARNWYRQRCTTDLEAKQKTSDLLAALAQSEVTLNLARTPNLLSLMAIVHRERAHLPDGKALLYDEIVNAYLNTIDKQRKIGPDDVFAHYGWKERKTWLAHVAFKMQVGRGWNSRGSGILATEKEVLSWLIEAMEVSGVPKNHQVAAEFLNWVARRSGLLLPRGEDRYAFVHLSFQEYFCACYLETCIVRPAFVMDNLPDNAPVSKGLLANWAKAHFWTETLIFLFELLSAEHDPEWAESLLNIVHDEGGDTSILSARLIKNKHVKLSTALHDSLAEGCARWVFSAWETGSGIESDVTSTLINSGYCAFCADFEEEERAVYAAKGVSLSTWSRDLSKVRFLIILGGYQLSETDLQQMINLKGLIVEGGNVIDIRNLRGLKKIEMIKISDVVVLGEESLREHSALRDLRISDVNIEDLGFLSSLKKITYLEVSEAPATDISSVASCKQINFLLLKGLAVTNLEPLRSLKKVETLILGGILATDISSVSSMKLLDFIQIYDTPIADLSPLKKCRNLENLDLENVSVEDLSPLAGLKNLEGVFLSGLPVQSLLPLALIPNLNYLYLKNLPMVDPTTLGTCIELSSFSFTDMDVKDIDFVADLPNLRMLTLGNLPIEDISSIRSLKKLTYIDLYHTNVNDASVLENLPSLRNVTIPKDSDLNLDFLRGNDRISISYRPDLSES